MDVGGDGGRHSARRNASGVFDGWREGWTMSKLPARLPETEIDRERRLQESRSEAETRGKVEVRGVRPSGAPFPEASPESGYYGIPLLKPPQWTHQIPAYF